MKRHSFFYKNSLTIVFASLFIISLFGQAVTGWKELNSELKDLNGRELPFVDYLLSGHFLQATFENWESEFLQMGLYILLTVFLRQKGSSESKKMDEAEEVDREPKIHPKAPWPVKKGGIWLRFYENSLSVAFFFLFFISFVLHFLGSKNDFNLEQSLKGKAQMTAVEFLGESKFWFESFQNWQSEFLSIVAIVIFTIFLRQKGSAQSKPVDAPNSETGD